MKINLICQYFPPEIGAPQARLSEMAREWIRQGHEVTVLTGFPNHPTGVGQYEKEQLLLATKFQN